jgi:hypothetical protein
MDPSRSDDHADLRIRAQADFDQLSAEWRDLVRVLLVHRGIGCQFPDLCIGPAGLAIDEMDAPQLRRLLWPALCQAAAAEKTRQVTRQTTHREGDPPAC